MLFVLKGFYYNLFFRGHEIVTFKNYFRLMINIDQTKYQEGLTLTQAYCEQQLTKTQKNYAAILRSFNPVIKDKDIFSFELGRYGEDADGTFLFFSKWNINPVEEENKSLYDDLFDKQLQHKKEIIGEVDGREFKGQVLIVEVESTIGDGGAEVESGGFIDFYDCPPIDTWFYKTEDEGRLIFFAWVPEPFVNLVNRGIEVNSIDCFYWYREGRGQNDNWHDEHLGEQPKIIVIADENPPSMLGQLKKLFS
jgi:hypothetical protein